MATSSNTSNSVKSKAKTEAKSKADTKAKAGAKSSSSKSDARSQVRAFAETAVDLPVGAVLSVTDRVGELAEPFTSRSGAEKQLKNYRGQVRRTLKRTERRGATARRQASAEARKTRTRVEREARKRQSTVRKTLQEQTDRAQELIDSLRP